MDLEKQKNYFKNHKATFTDYGNIKILDFKNPTSSHYRIRFLFEEDYCRLHISGDLGELIATNYNNMTYARFSDFVNDIGYFRQKINCHNRAIYIYDEDKAREDILEYINEYELIDDVIAKGYDWQSDQENIDEFIATVLGDFSDETGIGREGYDCLSEIAPDIFKVVHDFGKENTGILDLYMLAFKLAKQQLIDREAEQALKEMINNE